MFEEGGTDAVKAFTSNWNKNADLPNMDAPKLISEYLAPSTTAEATEGMPTKLTFSLSVPHG